ncbi:MAG: DUF2207 domain-containing protein [Synergistetes bacterium]|nr:DUF2207 domain-containing protein [Synergistota bacterium]
MFRTYPSKVITFFIGISLLALLLHPAKGLTKDYYLKESTVNIEIQESGLVRVTEKITYSFSGRFRFIERIIPLRGLRIENLSASVKGAAALFRKRIEQGKGLIVTAYISEDPNNINMGIENKDVTLIISYDLIGALKVFQDVAELFPKLWGEGWEKPLKLLKGEIELPQAGKVSLWIHPKDYLESIQQRGEKIILVFKNIPANQFIEARLIIPKEWFANATFAKKYDYPALSQIKEIETSYERKGTLLAMLAIAIIFIALFTPLFIYIKWGREVKISYHAPYEHEPPYPDPPSFVNAIMMGKIGVPTLEGFIGSILELVRKKFLEIRTEKGNDIILKIKGGSDDDLPIVEKEILDFLKSELKDGEKSWKVLTEKWKNSFKFKDFFDLWKEKVTWELNPARFFTDIGSKLLKLYGLIAIFLGIPFIALSSISQYRMFYPKIWNLLLASLGILILSGIISFFMPEQVGGRWTPFGRLYYMKWNAFKRFLSDFSLLKMHPPSSIAIWDKYLVYATALGVAEKTWKAMKFLIPKEVIHESTFYPVWNMPPIWIGTFRSSLAEAYSVKASEGIEKDVFSGFLGGSGGIGGIGGGFGGGGGRAG